jgi:glutathione S-transferase
MTIELYVFPLSPRCFKVMAIANHLGLDWTLRSVDLSKGEQKTPQYAALNPSMLTPTLGIKCNWPISSFAAAGELDGTQR